MELQVPEKLRVDDTLEEITADRKGQKRLADGLGEGRAPIIA
jgi:hypothetical protein